MIELVAAGSWAVFVAIARALPEIIRSRRACVTVTVTIREGGLREVAVTATNVDDPQRLLGSVLALQANRPRRRRSVSRAGRRTGPSSGPGRGGTRRASRRVRRG